MKERYEALELNIVKIPVEDTIMMMSNLEMVATVKLKGRRRSRLLGQRLRGSI